MELKEPCAFCGVRNEYHAEVACGMRQLHSVRAEVEALCHLLSDAVDNPDVRRAIGYDWVSKVKAALAGRE